MVEWTRLNWTGMAQTKYGGCVQPLTQISSCSDRSVVEANCADLAIF